MGCHFLLQGIFLTQGSNPSLPHLLCKEAILDFAKEFVEYLDSLDFETDDGVNDLHMLFGAVCALAEMQAALPGVVETTKPLRLVLDRRPFI